MMGAGDRSLPPTQVGTKPEPSLAPQWAAVVNIYHSGLVSGATSYPAPLQILTLCGIILFLVLEQMQLHSYLLYDHLTLSLFTGLRVHNCMIGNASSNQVCTILQFLLYSPTLGDQAGLTAG